MPYQLICRPHTASEVVFPLRWGRNTIGRSPGNSVMVNHTSMSRQHAEIAISDERLTLRDLDSLNGTFVNKVRIKQCELQDGDFIACGMVLFRFVAVAEHSQASDPDPLLEHPTERSADPDHPLTTALSATDVSEHTEEPDAVWEEIPIVHQFSAKQSRIVMQEILDPEAGTNSSLRLRQQNAAQRSVDKLKILLEVSKELSSPEEPEGLLEKILDLLMQIMHVDRAAILMVNDETRELEQRAVRSRTGMSVNYQFYSTKIVHYVCQHGNAVLTDDAAMDQRFEGSDSILVQAIRASMCVPLQPREETIGVLYADNLSRSKVFAEEDLEFLTALANQAAIAIENARLSAKMQAEAVWRDKLERFFPANVSRKLREGNLDIIETEVTALFADISDFTQMSARMEPRQVIEMLNDYFNVMVEEIVFSLEGTLEKYIGDALLAIWGAPYQAENDANYAVQAAIEMQWAVQRLNREWQEQQRQPIAVHIGLNTGPVAAGNIGSKRLIQYAAIGDTTNVASRICSVAKAGEILLSETTRVQLQGLELPLVALPPVRVKGKAEPLQLYRLDWREVRPSGS